VIAHRGASAIAPEHTVAAYDRAIEEGADYIELDVQRTSDGMLVVLHDTTLDRTARGPAENCRGAVGDKTMAQLRTCDVGTWFNEAAPELARAEFANLRILSLTEVIARYGGSTRLYIETKNPESYPGIESDVVSLLSSSGILPGSTDNPSVYIESFSAASLQKVHSLARSLPLIQLFGTMPAAEIVGQLPDVASYAAGIGPIVGDVNSALVRSAHANCLVVHPYTVDDSGEMLSLLATGVDGIFTDRPDLLRDMIGRTLPRTAGDPGCTAVARQ
jgi:glycerophosphoryl diester phosphodiesterase